MHKGLDTFGVILLIFSFIIFGFIYGHTEGEKYQKRKDIVEFWLDINAHDSNRLTQYFK